MRSDAETSAAVDALHAAMLRAGEDLGRVRQALDEAAPDEQVMLSLLRRAVPVRLLELLGTTPPWSDRPRVAARVVLNHRAPRALALRLVSGLYWHDLGEIAAAPWVAPAVRVRAEAALRDLLRDMRLGDRTALARMATVPVLEALVFDADPRVVEAALNNPRLREGDLVTALRKKEAGTVLVEAVAGSTRWKEVYAVRFALVLQPRTPLPIALLQLSSLVKRDLERVVAAAELKPLVRRAAQAVLDRQAEGNQGRTLNGSDT